MKSKRKKQTKQNNLSQRHDGLLNIRNKLPSLQPTMPFFKKSKSTLPSAYSAEQLASSDDSPQHRRLSAYDDPYTHPAHVARSQSHRHIASPPASPDWSDREPRIRNVFSRSAAKNSSRGFLERSLSVRRSDQSPTSPGPASGSGHALDSDQMQDCSPGLINRSNTDSSLDRSNRHPYRPSDQLYPPSARPETQQPVGPPSPFHSEMTAERERRDKEVKEKEEPKEEAVDVRALVQKHDELRKLAAPPGGAHTGTALIGLI